MNCQESMNRNSFLQKYVIKEFSQLYLAFLEQECWCFIKEQLHEKGGFVDPQPGVFLK